MERSDLKRLLAGELAGLVAGLEVEVQVSPDGLVHADTYRRRCASTRVSNHGNWRSARVGLDVLAQGCATCLRDTHALSRSHQLDMLVELVRQREVVARLGKPAEEVPSRVLARRRKEALSVAEQWTRWGPGLPAVAAAVAAELVESAKEAAEALERLAVREGVRAEVLERVKGQVVPKAWAGVVEVDETPVLVGVCPLPAAPTSEMSSVLEALSLRRGGATAVMLVPSYVHTFLVARLRSRPGDEVMVLSCPAPTSEAVAEAVASLWDPFGDSALVSLVRAVEAAEALEC
jgi:hypothetical protein